MSDNMDDPRDQDPPIVWVRCLLCGESMDRNEYEIHECDIIPFEEVT